MVLLSSEQALNWYWPRKNRYSKFRVHLAEKPGNLEVRGVNHLLNWFRLFYGCQLQETSQVNASTLYWKILRWSATDDENVVRYDHPTLRGSLNVDSVYNSTAPHSGFESFLYHHPLQQPTIAQRPHPL